MSTHPQRYTLRIALKIKVEEIVEVETKLIFINSDKD